MLNKTLMAIGAHADDHELQAGGTLAKYYENGYKIAYVMATNNMSGDWARLEKDGSIKSRKPSWQEIMPQRQKEASEAANFFGAKIINLGYPQRHYRDTENGAQIDIGYGTAPVDCAPPDLPTIITAYDHPKEIKKVSDLILEYKPEAIITHGGPMGNVEHFATLVLVTKAYWQAVEAGYNGMLLCWEDLGVNIFGNAFSKWDSFIDISKYFDKKLQASAIHNCQKPDPSRLDWPQWGPACGCEHAEVYNIINYNTNPEQYGAFTLEILNNKR